MTHEGRRRRRKKIAEAARVPGADLASVAKEFGVSTKLVYRCCRECRIALSHEERRRRRKKIAEAAQVPGADLASVAKEFGVAASLVYFCCREHGVPLPLATISKGRGRLNVFAVLRDLLAGQTMESCGVKYQVSTARIWQIADEARQAGWTELKEIAARNTREAARKSKKHGRPT